MGCKKRLKTTFFFFDFLGCEKFGQVRSSSVIDLGETGAKELNGQEGG